MVYALQVKLVQTVCGWFEMLIADRSFCFANSYDLKRDLWVKVNDKTCVTRCWNKNWPKFSKSCPKSTLNTFTLKGMFFKKPLKSPNMQANLLPKSYKNSPLWSHCVIQLMTCPEGAYIESHQHSEALQQIFNHDLNQSKCIQILDIGIRQNSNQ